MNAKVSQLVGNLNAKVLFQDKTYSLEYSEVAKEYCLVSIKSGECNWIIRYDSGKIAYDRGVVLSLHSRILKAITKHHKNENS